MPHLSFRPVALRAAALLALGHRRSIRLFCVPKPLTLVYLLFHAALGYREHMRRGLSSCLLYPPCPLVPHPLTVRLSQLP